MSSCLACGSKNLSYILELDDMPARVQNLSDRQAECFGDVVHLNLVKCPKCGLVQFDCSPVSYYKDVIRARDFSNKLKDLHRKQFKEFIDTYGLADCSIWEVGCGRGEMLALLPERLVRPFGIEHSSELVEEACKNGLDVIQGFVGDGDYRDPRGPFDAFLSINFLEHQPNPAAMLAGIRNNLVDGGMGLITVPSFEYFIQHAAYYELMRDHIASYDASSLSRLLTDAGFSIEEMTRFNEDTIAAVVRKQKEIGIKEFSESLERNRAVLEKQVVEFIAAEPKGAVAVWGASHQAFTLLSLAGLGPDAIRFIVDSAPFKSGKYAPGTGIPIVSPDDYANDASVTAIIIMAPGYSDEIADTIRMIHPETESIGTVIAGKLVRLM